MAVCSSLNLQIKMAASVKTFSSTKPVAPSQPFSLRSAAQTNRGGFSPADTVSKCHLPNKVVEWLLRSRALYCQTTGIATSLPCRRDGSRCSGRYSLQDHGLQDRSVGVGVGIASYIADLSTWRPNLLATLSHQVTRGATRLHPPPLLQGCRGQCFCLMLWRM